MSADSKITPGRRWKSRSEMRAILEGSPGRLVMLEMKDNITFLRNGQSNGTLTEFVETCHELGTDASSIIGEAQYLPADHPWGRRRKVILDTPAQRVVEITQPTPQGPLTALEITMPGQKPVRTKMFLEEEADYAAAIALLRELRNCRAEIVAHFTVMRREIGENGFLSIFVPQPLEMFFLILHEYMIYHLLDFPETYRRAMDEVEETSHFIIECAAEAEADMIIFGGAGTEVFNPQMIEEHILRPAIEFNTHAKQLGLFTLMHCCGRTRILLDDHWFDLFCPTIFESFTPFPLGDVKSPQEAARQLPPDTFFKGGVSLDILHRGTPAEVTANVEAAYRAFGDRRFVLAGTCAVLTGTPRENLLAVTKTAATLEEAEKRKKSGGFPTYSTVGPIGFEPMAS